MEGEPFDKLCTRLRNPQFENIKASLVSGHVQKHGVGADDLLGLLSLDVITDNECGFMLARTSETPSAAPVTPDDAAGTPPAAAHAHEREVAAPHVPA